MSYSTQSPARRKLIGLIFVGLAVRVVMPVGYMPAPIGEGLFVVCPGGLSGASLILDAQQHTDGHREHDAGEPTPWEHCPFGAAFGAATCGTDARLALPEFRQFLPSTHPQPFVRSAEPQPFHARAPPAVTPRYA